MLGEREGRVVTVPLNFPNVHCLALALDESSHCVAWAEVPTDDAKGPVILALRAILEEHRGGLLL